MRKWQPGYCRERHRDISPQNCRSLFCEYSPFEQLSEHRKARLYWLLCDARMDFDLRVMASEEPSRQAALAELAKIRNSVSILQRFSTGSLSDLGPNPAGHSAIYLIREAAEMWAAKQSPASLPQYFRPTRFQHEDFEALDYGTMEVIIRFFETSVLVHEWIKLAESKEPVQGWPDDFLASPRVWLIGWKLPLIYQYIFRKNYGISRRADQSISGGGVPFVLACLAAIKVLPETGSDWSAETVAKYYSRAKQAYGTLPKNYF